MVETATKPIVKWAGGKTKLLGELHKRIPESFGCYFEPFFGGGSLFFSLVPERAVLGDQNSGLMNLYRCIASDVEEVAAHVEEHKRDHCKEYYYRIREQWNEGETEGVESAARFLYLNKTCFNGLWRVNSKGEFNVPVGSYKNPRIYDLEKLRAASEVLKKANLCIGHYAEVSEPARSGDVVYFDPPYQPLTPKANFTSYTPERFDEDDQRDLELVARELVDRGCTVILSNSDTPLIREIYEDWRVDRVIGGQTIRPKAGTRAGVAELLITAPDNRL